MCKRRFEQSNWHDAGIQTYNTGPIFVMDASTDEYEVPPAAATFKLLHNLPRIALRNFGLCYGHRPIFYDARISFTRAVTAASSRGYMYEVDDEAPRGNATRFQTNPMARLTLHRALKPHCASLLCQIQFGSTGFPD